MLPLTLLNLAAGQSVSVELKTGAVVEGKLEKCDTHMNVLLSTCICIAADGTRTTLEEFYARGPVIKMVQVPDHLLDEILVERRARREERRMEDAREAAEKDDRRRGARNDRRGGARFSRSSGDRAERGDRDKASKGRAGTRGGRGNDRDSTEKK